MDSKNYTKSLKEQRSFVFDADGMVLVKNKVFSIRLSEKLNIGIEEILPFFKANFQLCLIGKADLKEELVKFKNVWGWNGSVNSLLKFWFEGENELNNAVVDFVKEMRRKQIPVYLATNNEKYRTNYLLKKIGLGKVFNNIFSSAGLGSKKPYKEFYQTMLKRIGNVNPANIQFWDDDIENVLGAKAVGMDAQLYEDIEGLKKVVEVFLIS